MIQTNQPNMLCSNVCFVALVGDQKPNVNNQFFVLFWYRLPTNNVLLLKFEKKEKLQFVKRRDSLAWLDFFSNWTSLQKLFSVSDYMMIVTKKAKSFYCPLIFFFITIYLDESSVEPVTSEVTSGHGNSKYTGQYKKNTAPNKPARKHKPKSAHDHTGESRSDRSASPDNSSTSGNIFLITVLKIRKFQKQNKSAK